MKPESGNADSTIPPAPKKASLLQVIRIVISMLFMIGRNRDYGPDAPAIAPAQLIIVAIVGAALLIAGLVFLATSIAH
jgi:Protein of unknown function (DUF2970)